MTGMFKQAAKALKKEPMKQVKGTVDIIGKEALLHRAVISTASQICQQNAFSMNTLGEDTEVVNKELYTFMDKSNQALTLRPEGTAAVARSFITNGMHKSLPKRLYYHGPMFRYENPQKGRLRQFEQFGIEWFGASSALSDFEGIQMAWELIERLGLSSSVKLHLNTLGDSESRFRYRTALAEFLYANKSKLSRESLQRLERGSFLRVLDSKEPEDRVLIDNNSKCPRLYDHLGKGGQHRFEQLQSLLSSSAIPYVHDHNLVRGLGYYCHTVFEMILEDHDDALGKTQNTILAGGRYDGMLEQMSHTSLGSSREVSNIGCFGWAAGINRLVALVETGKFQQKWLNVDLMPQPPVLFQIQANELHIDAVKNFLEGMALFRQAGFNTVALTESLELSHTSNASKQLKKLSKKYQDSNLCVLYDVETSTWHMRDMETKTERLSSNIRIFLVE